MIQLESQASHIQPQSTIERQADTKVCRKCGKPLLTAADTYPHAGRVCRACHGSYNHMLQAVRRTATREGREYANRLAINNYHRKNARTRQAAQNYRRPYSSDDVRVLLDRDVSHQQAAILLRRTFAAVRQERRRIEARLALSVPLRAHASPPAKYLLPTTTGVTS